MIKGRARLTLSRIVWGSAAWAAPVITSRAANSPVIPNCLLMEVVLAKDRIEVIQNIYDNRSPFAVGGIFLRDTPLPESGIALQTTTGLRSSSLFAVKIFVKVRIQ
jgi:hypothetical protein